MFLRSLRRNGCSENLIWKVITEKNVKEIKRESKRKGKIASDLKYYAVFAHGGRFGKTPRMRYIEMRAYVQGPAPFERDIKERSFYSVPEQGSFIL